MSERVIEIGGPGGQILAWLIAVAFVPAVALSVFLFRALVLANDKETIAGVFFVSALMTGFLGYGSHRFWNDVTSLSVLGDGTWSMRNHYGVVIRTLPGHTRREIEVWTETTSDYDPDRTSASHWQEGSTTHLFVRASNGQAFELAGEIAQMLGYERGACGATASDLTWPGHEYGPTGPLCDGMDARAVRYVTGEVVFVKSEDEAWWYPARISGVRDGEVAIDWTDRSRTWVVHANVRKDLLGNGDEAQCRWKSDGRYYNCKVETRVLESLRVMYEDDTTELTTIFQVRISDAAVQPRGTTVLSR